MKICGLTTTDGVGAAVDSGADAIGFVFDSRSRRYVTPFQARRLGAERDILRVGVTVDAPWEVVEAVIDQAGLDGVQPHGRNASDVAEEAGRAGMFVLRPFNVTGTASPDSIPPEQMMLVEGTDLGGTGASFDWKLLDGFARQYVLAGGLGPLNVRGAIESLQPWGVDASSALESQPGTKDPQLISRFVEEAKR